MNPAWCECFGGQPFHHNHVPKFINGCYCSKLINHYCGCNERYLKAINNSNLRQRQNKGMFIHITSESYETQENVQDAVKQIMADMVAYSDEKIIIRYAHFSTYTYTNKNGKFGTVLTFKSDQFNVSPRGPPSLLEISVASFRRNGVDLSNYEKLPYELQIMLKGHVLKAKINSVYMDTMDINVPLA